MTTFQLASFRIVKFGAVAKLTLNERQSEHAATYFRMTCSPAILEALFRKTFVRFSSYNYFFRWQLLFPAILFLLPLPCTAGKSMSDQVRMGIREAGGIEQLLSNIAARAAKKAPQMINSETEFIGMASFGKTMVNYSRLVNYSKAEVTNLTAWRSNTIQDNSRAICSSPISSVLINEHDVTYEYIVYAKDKQYIFGYVVDRSACRKINSQR